MPANTRQLQSIICELKEGRKGINKIRKLNEEMDVHANLQEFWDASPDLFAVIASNGKFVAINHAWSETLGYSKKEVLNKHWTDFFVPEDNNIMTALNRCAVVLFTNSLKTKDGKSVTLEWHVRKLSKDKYYAIARLKNLSDIRKDQVSTEGNNDTRWR